MKGYIAYNLNSESISQIQGIFVPKFKKAVCHHVTLEFGVDSNKPLPSVEQVVAIAYACNENIECLVVSVNGTTHRPDGSFYHVTLSHNENAKPFDSNKLKDHTPIEQFEIEGKVVFNPF